MQEENPSVDSLAGDTQLISPAEETKVGSVQPAPEQPKAEDLSLNELNTYLGQQFKNKESALKALKDTFSYVGKKKDDIIKELSPTAEMSKELAELKENLFFEKNPDYAPHRALIKRLGNNPAEVVNLPEFKSIFEGAKAHDEYQKRRTVLESNPRLVQTKDTFGKASEAMKAGRKEDAEALIAKAILNSLEE